MNQTPKIGAYVLETLTTGMYTNPLDTLREFVQNAADSIREAEETGLILRGEGRIEVRLDPKSSTLAVRDNGIGIPQADVYNRLMNIGMSAKRIETDAGFRGIGRLAGIAYCRTLHFHTSSVTEVVESKVEIDCEGLRQAISPAKRQTEELADVVARNSKTGQERNKADSHFFEVVMEGLTDTVSELFLSWEKVESYLCQVAPIEYDAQYFTYATVITDWMRKNKLRVPIVKLVIKAPDNVERQVFKPYKTRYKTRGAKDIYKLPIKNVAFYPESPSPDAPLWLWYSKSDLLGTIDDEQSAGLRLRKNNIGIGGPERVAQLFADVAESNTRFNGYYIGEIHVASPEAVPNARRDGFEDAGAWPKIKLDLMPFVRERCDEIRTLSEARNRPTEKVVRSAEKVIDDATERLQFGIVSEKERDSVLARVVKEEEKATSALETRKDTPDATKIEPIVEKLRETHQALEQENHFAVKKLRSHLDRKQRQIIREILAILYETLDESEFKKARAAILAKFQISESETNS
jgi:hypothetical protein